MKLPLLATILTASAAAHPVSFEGAYQLMLGGNEMVQSFELYHSYTPKSAFGLHVMRFDGGHDDPLYLPNHPGHDGERGEDDLFAGLQHNWLLKRWNLPEAQANLYFGAGAGLGKEEGNSWSPAGLGYFRADYETRRIYTAFDSKFIGAEDVSRGVTSASFGVAPYKAEFDQLNTWLIVQLEHVSGMEDDLDVIPKIRFFKGTYFVELGCSLDGDPLVNFMMHF